MSRPDTLPSLAAGVDASGQAQAWWTLGELSGLERAGRVVVAEGIKWVLPASLARSTLSGAEALAKAGALRVAATIRQAAPVGASIAGQASGLMRKPVLLSRRQGA